jgi:hypothetical protein
MQPYLYIARMCSDRKVGGPQRWRLEVGPLVSSWRGPHFKTRKSLGKNKIMVMGADRVRNQDRLC